MRVLILGVGDAFTATGFGASALIEAPGGLVLLDCPDLIGRAVRQACESSGWSASLSDIDHVLLTHLHGDHCNGLESFGFRRFAERTRGEELVIPTIHTHPPAADRLWERLAPAMDAPLIPGGSRATLGDFFDVNVFTPDSPASVAGLTVECRTTKHPIPCVGLKISDGERTLGWSGDTVFDQDHIDWLADSDLIVHEANRSPLHTSPQLLNGLPDELRAKMRLTHTEDGFDPKQTDIPLLREGDVLFG